jgi:vitamin K-dependent gamma-carboxylase
MALAPAHHVFSLDRARGAYRGDGTVPRWALFALRAQIVVVYFFGGIAKINPDWLRGEPIGSWLLDFADGPLVGPLFALPYSGLAFAWSGLAIDLTIGFLLLWRRTFWPAVAVAVLFHLINSQIFDIGIFPFFMIATLVLFGSPDWPRVALTRLVPLADAAKPAAGPAPRAHGARLAVVVVLHIYFLAQLALPLRHWLYPGDVNWTEEGHRFSWRMKLRDKEVVEFVVTATDPRTGEQWEVDPYDTLVPRQYDKMVPRPDMIQQFARHVATEYERERGARPRITVRARASLNGGPVGDLIDPTVDLAAEPVRFGAATWIVSVAPMR